MRAKHRLVTGTLAMALVATLLPMAAAAAELVPGRPGRYELSSIQIDATSGDCKATYDTPAAGNLWMRGVGASVRVSTTPRWVHVTCRFTDMSALIEGNAEVGYTDACTLVTGTATYTDGWGIATSAANVSERAEGGTSMAMCRFPVLPTAAAPGSPASGAARAAGTDGGVEVRGRGGSARVRGSNAAKPARDDGPAKRLATQRDDVSKTRAPAKAAARPSAKDRTVTRAGGHTKRGPRADRPGRGRPR